MSRRKSSLFSSRGRGRRSSKIMWISIGIFVFALFVFPYFGSNLAYLISSSLSPLKSAGALLQTCGLVITVAGIFGMSMSAIGSESTRPVSKRSIKITLVGILMLAIGLFLSNPLNLASLFTGGSTTRGYHFFY
jgi:hypothetical protein